MKKGHESFASIGNCYAVKLKDLPTLEMGDFAEAVIGAVNGGQRLSSFFGVAGKGSAAGRAGAVTLYAILADDAQNRLNVARAEVRGNGFPSLSPRCAQAQLFEREIAEQFGLKPEGHPWFKPVRYCRSMNGKDAWGRPASGRILPAVGDFYRVEGEQVHEVAVGPVHAGVIEPGHFRFQCHGEKVFHLEIALGFQHRGIEEALIGGPDSRTLHYMETAAGDTSVGHATSYCQIVETLSKTQGSAHSYALRGIALELERLANHVGDLGALSGDVGYLPTASYCGRIRGDFLNLTAFLCGNRFGRGLVRPGGTGFDLDDPGRDEMARRLKILEREASDAIKLLWDEQSVMSRFEDTGRLSKEQAIELGLVGPAARAAGIPRDARYDQPCGIYRFAQMPISTCESGDVFARAYVRWMEVERSLEFIMERLDTLPPPAARPAPKAMSADSLCVSINEGWRGEICHVALTDAKGKFARYKIVDPSFHNWFGLAQAVRNQEVSDFPLCNKSFNLSYCGHDL
jgi:Ni,Fe-hydrogenase III large subunit